MRAYERFLKYVSIDTTANSASAACPSSPNQLVLGAELVREMKEMGIEDARMDEYGYVYGSIPANIENQPSIGLIAHMDTAEDAPASPMKVHIVENYQGGDLMMDEEGKNILRQSEYPMLANYIGHDLIITDGNTLLGADDKAGIAEIMTFAEQVLSNPSLKHGRIAIGFTPDEEIGRGPDHFDYKGFGADFAYTLDGGPLPEIECENFNAASAAFEITGVSTHPGGAKGRMKNAALIAAELIHMMPPAECPEHTSGYEGFYHLVGMSGSVEKAKVGFIIRDHDMTKFTARKAFAERVASYLNGKYGDGTVKLELKDSYFNMLEAMKPNMHVMTRAEDAIRKIGFEPRRRAIRGGTDGATLTNNGLPCPNLPTGGMFAHGRRECICIQEMDKIVEMIEKIICVD